MDDCANLAPMFAEEAVNRVDIANIDFVMFIFAQIFYQLITRGLGRGLGPEKLRAHVIIDPNHTQPVLRETFRSFRTNEAG